MVKLNLLCKLMKFYIVMQFTSLQCNLPKTYIEYFPQIYFLMKFTDSPLCNFIKFNTAATQHPFTECSEVYDIWYII